MQTVADNFSLPPTMIRRWNHLRGDSLRGRRIVYVHLPGNPERLVECATGDLGGLNLIKTYTRLLRRRCNVTKCNPEKP